MTPEEKLTATINLLNRAVDRYIPCPDHRDKVDYSKTGCPQCEIERLRKIEAQYEVDCDAGRMAPNVQLMNEQIRVLRERVEQLQKVLQQALAAVWDGHYGKGLAVEYVREIDRLAGEVGVTLSNTKEKP